jgi:asparagine synthetase B (glutamine-hydrolysing)
MVFFFSKGEDAPTEDDIEYFGLYEACVRSIGNFSLFKDGDYAAKGRTGTSPLYWNRDDQIFSFVPGDGLVDFPDGHMYNMKHDRLVCWDPLYFDKPLDTHHDSIIRISKLLRDAVNKCEIKSDAFIMSAGCGSRLIDQFLDEDKYAYTVAFSPGTCFDVENFDRENRSIVFFDETTKYPSELDSDEAPMYVLARYLKNTTNHRKFICGLGCTELFSPSTDFRPYVKHVVDQFAKFGLEVYSPFFDRHLMEYVLDMTNPLDRPGILDDLLGDYDTEYGQEIHETVGVKPQSSKKNWWRYW